MGSMGGYTAEECKLSTVLVAFILFYLGGEMPLQEVIDRARMGY